MVTEILMVMLVCGKLKFAGFICIKPAEIKLPVELS